MTQKPFFGLIACTSILIGVGCNLDVGSGTTTADLEAARAQANPSTSTATAQNDDAEETGSESATANKPVTAPTVNPTPAPAPAPAPTPAPVTPVVNTGGALYQAGGNSITLRSDFAAVAGRVDALTRINDPHHPGAKGSASSVAIPATRSGNTWIIPQALASYPAGNIPNTWRIALTGTPPAGVTYHVNIMQTFVRTTDFGTGKTYPPTTR